MAKNRTDIISAAQQRMVQLFERRKTPMKVLDELTDTTREALESLRSAGLDTRFAPGHSRSLPMEDTGPDRDGFTRRVGILSDGLSSYALTFTYTIGKDEEPAKGRLRIGLQYHSTSPLEGVKPVDKELLHSEFDVADTMAQSQEMLGQEILNAEERLSSALDKAKEMITDTVIEVISRNAFREDPSKDPRENKRFKRALTP